MQSLSAILVLPFFGVREVKLGWDLYEFIIRGVVVLVYQGQKEASKFLIPHQLLCVLFSVFFISSQIFCMSTLFARVSNDVWHFGKPVLFAKRGVMFWGAGVIAFLSINFTRRGWFAVKRFALAWWISIQDLGLMIQLLEWLETITNGFL